MAQCLVMVRVTVAVFVIAPLVALMLRVRVPVAVVPDVVIVSVEVPELVIWVGLNDAVPPDGRPLMVRDSVPVKPPSAEIDTV